MKKNSKKMRVQKTVTAEQAVQFLEDMRIMSSEQDEPTVAISLRVPQNILRALKTKARVEGKKYQSLMIEYFRKGLRS